MTNHENKEKEITLDQAREIYKTFDVIAPELDEQMRPLIQLINKSECPAKLDGICAKCEYFFNVYSEDGTIFSHGVYEGFCAYKGEEDGKQ